jgi:fatty acid desaturase
MNEIDVRASDGDRERAVDRLRAHAAEGRLTVEELEERVQRALAARTVGELAELLRDLPNETQRARAPRRRSSRPELTTFVAVMVLLIATWALSGAGYFWPMWPLLGWGVFVLGPINHLGFPACRPSGSSRR